jgi:hypothetical protein
MGRTKIEVDGIDKVSTMMPSPGAYQPLLTGALRNLGFLYVGLGRPKGAEAALRESLDTSRIGEGESVGLPA